MGLIGNMVKHNNVLHKNHFRKHWMRRVKCFFNKAAHKKIRAQKRAAKAAAISPRPLGLLRPVVHSCTRKYAGKTRLGRGFSLAELKEAGLSAAFARSVGIAVDHRRHNKSAEMQAANVARLSAYKSKLILFPRRDGKTKKGEINDSDKKLLSQAKNGVAHEILKLPAKAEEAPEFQAITKEMKAFSASKKLHDLRFEKRDYGKKMRKKQLADAAKK